MGRLIIDGNCVYEVDEECLHRKEWEKRAEIRNGVGSPQTKGTSGNGKPGTTGRGGK